MSGLARYQVSQLLAVLEAARDLNNDEVSRFCKDVILKMYYLQKFEACDKVEEHESRLVDFFETFPGGL